MNRLLGDARIDALTATRIALIWVFAWLGFYLVKVIARRVTAAATAGEHGGVHHQRAQTVAQLLRSAGFAVILFLAVFSTLQTFQVNVTPFLEGAGFLGLAVSFGAQSLVKDYFAGFFILFENQFVVGDWIDVAGKAGTVERMTLRIVTLRDTDGTIHIVPNGQIATVSNKTRGWSRAVVDVGVSYDTDIDQALAVLRDVAREFGNDPAWAPRFDSAPEVLGVEAFGDTGVTVRSFLRTRPAMQAEVAREFRRRVIVRLEEEGIKGARTQQVINIHNPPSGLPTTTAPAVAPPPIPGSA
ncbi:MAG TPA: mechanosensitive ion channel family protein [Gemmatimonadales bacterium]|nr:mechanosensitive ion channel family protein [Gemmatimonadales bacterium]